MNIRSTSKIFAVIGDPVAHSLSPVLQNGLIELFNLDAVYVAFRIRPAYVAEFIFSVKLLNLAGVNVTTPHKQNVISFVNKKSPDVERLSSANTLVHRDGKVIAHATDATGFIESLGARKKYFKKQTVVIFGAGGSARSVALALAQLGIKRLLIVNRTVENAETLAEDAMGRFGVPQAMAIAADSANLNEFIRQSRIVINTTSLGMHPNTDAMPMTDFSAVSSNHFFYDLVYNPDETMWLKKAREQGAEIQNGLDMLIFQGLESMRIWFETPFKLTTRQLNSIRARLQTELRRYE